MHKIKRTLRAILSYAKKQRLINDNYANADYIDFPKRPSKEIDYMNDEDPRNSMRQQIPIRIYDTKQQR